MARRRKRSFILRVIRTFFTVFLLMLLGSYLLFSDAGLDPQAHFPPSDAGLTGDFAENTALQEGQLLSLRGSTSPEDIALHPDGSVWTLTRDGELWRIEGDRVLAVGRISDDPLGLEWSANGEALYITDTNIGLLRWTPDGGTEVLVDQLEGAPLTFANQLAVARDGTVYFSVSTRRWRPQDFGGTLEASIHDLWEHHTSGVVVRWSEDQGARVIARGFNFVNGVAFTPEEDALLIAETGTYTIWRLDLTEEGATPMPLIENLPGFPDNLQAQGDGTYWLGLVSLRRGLADTLAPYPWVRAIVWRLPEFVRPTPNPHGLLVRFDADGKILSTLHDPSGEVTAVTGGVVSNGTLYVSSLSMGAIRALPAP